MSKLSVSCQLGAAHNHFQNQLFEFKEGVSTHQLSLEEMKAYAVALKNLYSEMKTLSQGKNNSFWRRVPFSKAERQPRDLYPDFDANVLDNCREALHVVDRVIQQKQRRILNTAACLPWPDKPKQRTMRMPFACFQVEVDERPIWNACTRETRSFLQIIPQTSLFPFLSYMELCQTARTCKIWHNWCQERGETLHRMYYTNICNNTDPLIKLPSQPNIPLFMQLEQQVFNGLADDSEESLEQHLEKVMPIELHACRNQFLNYFFYSHTLKWEHRNYTKMQELYEEQAIVKEGKDRLQMIPKSVFVDNVGPCLNMKDLSQLGSANRQWRQIGKANAARIYADLNTTISQMNAVFQKSFPQITFVPVQTPPHLDKLESPSFPQIQVIVDVIAAGITKNFGDVRAKKMLTSDTFHLVSHHCTPLYPTTQLILTNCFELASHSYVHVNILSQLLLSNQTPNLLQEYIKNMGKAGVTMACEYLPDEVLLYLQTHRVDPFFLNLTPTAFRSLIRSNPKKTWDVLHPHVTLPPRWFSTQIFVENMTLWDEWFVHLVTSNHPMEAFELLEQVRFRYNKQPFHCKSTMLSRSIITLFNHDFERVKTMEGEHLFLSAGTPNKALDVYLSHHLEEWQDLVAIQDVVLLKQMLDSVDAGQTPQARHMVADPQYRNEWHHRLIQVVRERNACGQFLQSKMVEFLIRKATQFQLFKTPRPFPMPT